MPDWILEFLRCPHSNGRLVRASQAELDILSERARAGKLLSVLGRTISEVPSQGLVSSNGQWFYAVEGGIASMLVDEAVDLLAK